MDRKRNRGVADRGFERTSFRLAGKPAGLCRGARGPLRALLAAAVLWLGGSAGAEPACDDPVNLPNPVYLTVGDTQTNLMKELGRQLREKESVTLIFRATGSCTNLDTLYGHVKMSGNFSYIPAGYDPAKMPTPPTCTVPMPGVEADIANSIVFLEGCPSPRPSDVLDVLGPVQGFAFVVPRGSSQLAITAEEAYFVFGFGMNGRIAPWLDNRQLLIRPVTKGTIISIGASIGVPAARWQGVPVNLSQELASMLASAPDPEKALGILGSEVYDGYRATLKALAFRAYKQRYAYFPDSTAASFDKRNVRDGHYHMWSYTHWLLHIDGQGKPQNPLARRVVDLIAGSPVLPPPSFEPLEPAIRVGLIPQCAMKVQRAREGGDFLLYAPPEPCGCYFEDRVQGSACKRCANSAECGSGACRRGFCEER